MNAQLSRGQQIRVSAYGGKTPKVTVVEDRGDIVLICKPSEFEKAAEEEREPLTVGFHRSDVLLEASAGA